MATILGLEFSAAGTADDLVGKLTNREEIRRKERKRRKKLRKKMRRERGYDSDKEKPEGKIATLMNLFKRKENPESNGQT